MSGQDGGLRLGTCLLYEDFQGGAIPSGWAQGPPVEQQDNSTGLGTGTFVDAWTVGTSPHVLDHDGLFLVPDVPAGNLFARTNDDDAPCNCDLAAASLTTPSIDLSGVTGAQLTFRSVVHRDFGGAAGQVEVSTDGGGSFQPVHVIPGSGPVWSYGIVDLSTFDGAPDVRIRFSWSDQGNWAVGMGVDDICVSPAYTNDLRLLDAFVADITLPEIDPAVSSLPVSAIPLSLAGELVLSGIVANVGLNDATGVSLEAEVFLDGVSQGTFQGPTSDLPSRMVDTLVLHTGWTPPMTGKVDVEIQVVASQPDEDQTDNLASATYQVTGPAWGEGDNQFALDAGTVERGLSNGASGFIVAARLEVTSGPVTFHGASAAFADGTVPGALVRVELRDDQFSPIVVSAETAVPQSAINGPGGDSFAYIPFEQPAVVNGPADVYVCLSYANTNGEVVAGCSGQALPGAAWFFDNQELLWARSLVSPMIRAHLDNSVGFANREHDRSQLDVFPVPCDDRVTIRLPEGALSLELLDAQGRTLSVQTLGSSAAMPRTMDLAIEGLPAGTYVAVVRTREAVMQARLVVSH